MANLTELRLTELRDMFAVKAMEGLIAADTLFTMSMEVIARLAYEQADAMLKQRKL